MKIYEARSLFYSLIMLCKFFIPSTCRIVGVVIPEFDARIHHIFIRTKTGMECYNCDIVKNAIMLV